MCRWHKYAAKEAATNPHTGEFNVGHYAVALTAMGLFRIEQEQWKMPELFSIDGFNPEEILPADKWNAFERSGLSKPTIEAQRDLAHAIADMRYGLEQTALAMDLSKEGLDITDRITKDGYKKTCCAAPNPRDNGPQLDAAVVYLVKGYDGETRDYASKPLKLISADELDALQSDLTVADKDRALLPRLHAIRIATELFLEQSGVVNALEQAFKNTIPVIFQMAERDLKEGRGLTGASECIMCEGTKGRKPAALNLG